MSPEVEMSSTLGSTHTRRLFLVVAIVACAPPSTATRLAHSPRAITLEEISIAGASNVDDLLRRRRPLMLLPRAPRSGGNLTEVTPMVYVNGMRAGGIDVLHLIPAATVLRVELLTETEADSRFYGQHPGGVIALVTRSPWRR
jgi:hypothetical protein